MSVRACPCVRLKRPPDRIEATTKRFYTVAAGRCRRICTSTFATIPVTATMKITLPITFTCGGAPTRAEFHTKTGNVTRGPALKYVTTKSSTETAKHSSIEARIAGEINGSVTFVNVAHSF